MSLRFPIKKNRFIEDNIPRCHKNRFWVVYEVFITTNLAVLTPPSPRSRFCHSPIVTLAIILPNLIKLRQSLDVPEMGFFNGFDYLAGF